MKALVYTGPESLEYRDEPDPVSNADILVKIVACGICGSDMHAYLGHDERRNAPLILGQTLTRLDYEHTRDVLAAGVIGALDRYYEGTSEYPDDLQQLVASGHLEDVPRPRIGFAALSEQEFVYQNFGTNYVLEFSSPRWIQCAYNPPWEEELLDDEEGEEAESLGGSWSCPTSPPELW